MHELCQPVPGQVYTLAVNGVQQRLFVINEDRRKFNVSEVQQSSHASLTLQKSICQALSSSGVPNRLEGAKKLVTW